MSSADIVIPLADEGKVLDLANTLYPLLFSPLVVYLQGDLGAGKTTFARALIQALGHKGRVKSPTYGLLESYQTGGFNILHLDLYRIEAPGELDFLGLRDLFDNKSILLIEWPEKGGEFIPRADLLMQFGEDNEQRFVALRVISSAGRKVVARL